MTNKKLGANRASTSSPVVADHHEVVPLPGQDGRVRRVITRSGRRHRIKFPSKKLGRMVHCESLVEEAAARHFEYDPGIDFYQEQPTVIHYYLDDGSVRKYCPDFMLRRRDGSQVFIEVKTQKSLMDAKLVEKLAAIALRMNELDIEFKIWTDEDIYKEPRDSNVKRIHEALRTKGVNPRFTPNIDLEKGLTVTFSALREHLGSDSLIFMHYVAGHIDIDLNEPITDKTLIYIL